MAIDINACNNFLDHGLDDYLAAFKTEFKQDPAGFRKGSDFHASVTNITVSCCEADTRSPIDKIIFGQGKLGVTPQAQADGKITTITLPVDRLIEMGVLYKDPASLDILNDDKYMYGKLSAEERQTTRKEQYELADRYHQVFHSVIDNLTIENLVTLQKAGVFSSHNKYDESNINKYEYSDVIAIRESVEDLRNELLALEEKSPDQKLTKDDIQAKAIECFKPFMEKSGMDPIISALAKLDQEAHANEPLKRGFSMRGVLSFTAKKAPVENKGIKSDAALTSAINSYHEAAINLIINQPSEALHLIYNLQLSPAKIMEVLTDSQYAGHSSHDEILKLYDASYDLHELVSNAAKRGINTDDYRFATLKEIVAENNTLSESSSTPDSSNSNKSRRATLAFGNTSPNIKTRKPRN